MKNKSVKTMICAVYKNTHVGSVEFCTFKKALYAWHYPPVEGGWDIKQGVVSITGKELKGS
ncbi:hypothetical protein NVP1193O_032 [Vibrio phage 1.193.O._10N.286.52.C6]|nr:hypothetical protein NVP1193O_032 [Vibrio phage 1.193.O._10N.286.52.C6]